MNPLLAGDARPHNTIAERGGALPNPLPFIPSMTRPLICHVYLSLDNKGIGHCGITPHIGECARSGVAGSADADGGSNEGLA
jgi:hypothetical protein